MKILLVGSFEHEIYAPAFASGFKQLGHEVIKIENEKYYLPGNNIVSKFHNKFQGKYHFGLLIWKYNREIIRAVNKHNPNFVFLYRCDNIFNSTLRKIKKKTIVFSYNNDDPFVKLVPQIFSSNFIGNSRHCDIVYVYRKKNIDDFLRIGVAQTKLLLPYYMSYVNYHIDNIEKDISIAFVGHFEDDGRDTVIKELYEANLPVFIYGKDYWITQSKLYEQLKPIIKEPKSGAEYNKLLNRIQIALVFLSQRNNDTYTRRCFEIPAARTLMLAPYTKELDELFPEDKCAVYYRSTEDLIEKCKNLLANPEVIDKIANAGYERLSLIGGSEIDRCREIIKDYENIKKSK